MLNNKRNILIVISVFLLIGIVTFGISFALRDNDDVLSNQKVDGLSFENAKVEYINDVSTFSVIIYNENSTVYNASSIDINIKDKNGKDIKLIGEVGTPLETNEGRLITATVSGDITDMKDLEYVINKED